MRFIFLPCALALAALAPVATPLAQDRATGTVTVDPPQPRGFTVEQGGRTVTGVLPRGAVADIAGANVIIEETPQATRLTVQNDVLFDFDKAELRSEAAAALGRVADIIRQRSPRRVRIVGYTDSLGADAYNQTLSERRARSVEQWLAGNGGGGLPPIEAAGRGEQDPVAPNTGPGGADDPAGRQRNRRVEVLLER